jgi:alpha/beta superfamily hydrolase
MPHRPAPGATSRLVPFSIPGPAGALEALLQEHEGHGATLTAIVCHPHPLYGGTMHNKVVHRVASVLHERGAVVLRFNFRGAGQSEGTHDRGVGETEDARAALRYLRERYPHAKRWAAGFSFGSAVAARLAASEPEIERLILIAPPVASADFGMLRTLSTPKIVVQGSADVTCPPELLKAQFPGWSEPKSLIEVAGATHFFDKHLADLGQALRQALPGA